MDYASLEEQSLTGYRSQSLIKENLWTKLVVVCFGQRRAKFWKWAYVNFVCNLLPEASLGGLKKGRESYDSWNLFEDEGATEGLRIVGELDYLAQTSTLEETTGWQSWRSKTWM